MDQTVFIPPDVIPQVGLVTQIANGGVAVLVFNPGAYGGYITNPYTAGDQGIDPVEVLYVDPFGPPSLQAFGTTVAISPGQSWSVPIPKSTSGVWVNATTTNHRFTAVFWIGP